MLKRSGSLALGILVLLSFATGPAHAQTAKCQAAKIKAAGKKASCLLSAEAKAAAKAGTADFTKCKSKFMAAFTKAEAGTCATTGDVTTIENKVDSFVTELAVAIALTPPSKCQAAKLKAAGKKASCLLGAEAKALTKATTPDFTKCKSKFMAAFTKAETGSDCGATAGDSAAVEAKVDALDDDVACELDAGPACACGSGTPATLNFTTSLGSGNCGNVQNSSGASIQTLACNNLLTGGGGGSVPASTVPDHGTTITKATCCRNKFVALNAATSADTGSNRNCSNTGCLYGPPLPITSGASVCVINKVAQPAVGYAYCDAGSTSLNIPLNSDIWLTVDSLPKRCNDSSAGAFVGRVCTVDGDCGGASGSACVTDPTIQPCPICNPSTLVCNGGPNDGMACTPGSLLVTGPQWPTSHDCPPPGALIGTLPIPYLLGTDASSKTSVDLPSQVRVFCGFCGDPANAVFHNPAVACTSDADCAAFTTGCGANPCTACKQRTSGSFGTQAARTITENGSPAGPISVGGPAKPQTLADVFCIPPTFNGTIDSVGDLPGPGAVSIQGSVQLLP
jgi:hypothetical protein